MEFKTTKSKILKAMYDLIAEVGYDKASIGQIADLIGIKKASVYYYFRFKEEILMELVEHLFEIETNDLGLDSVNSRAEFKEYILNKGYSLIHAFECKPKARRVFAEIDIQINRISLLKEYVESYNLKEKKKWQNILQYGKTIQAISQNLDIDSNTDFIFTVLSGIDDALLYQYPVNVKKVWDITVEAIMGGNGNNIHN